MEKFALAISVRPQFTGFLISIWVALMNVVSPVAWMIGVRIKKALLESLPITLMKSALLIAPVTV